MEMLFFLKNLIFPTFVEHAADSVEFCSGMATSTTLMHACKFEGNIMLLLGDIVMEELDFIYQLRILK